MNKFQKQLHQSKRVHPDQTFRLIIYYIKQIGYDLQQQLRIKLMRFSCYDWNPKRFHPEFSGIAQRYADHKKRRLAYQMRRKQLDSDKAYSVKLNQQIQKQIYSKTLQLNRLKQAKKRHLQALNFKQFLFEKRREEILSLRGENQKERSILKSNIALARKNIQARNQQHRLQLQHQSRINSSKLQALLNQKHKQKQIKCQKVKEDEKKAESRITQFHREQNERSFTAYCRRISEEKRAKVQQQRKIKKHEKQIALMNQSVQIKKRQLSQVESQISEMTSQSRTLSIATKLKQKRRQLTDVSQHTLPFRTRSNASLNSSKDPDFSKFYKNQ